MPVGQVVECDLVRDADVVHEASDRTDRRFDLSDDRFRRARLVQVGDDGELGARPGPRLLDALGITAADDDASTFRREKLCRLEADPRCGARDETDTIAEPQVHLTSLLSVATTLFLARHGETDWNRELRWQGHADTELNELGRGQARDLAERLGHEPIAAVYASDLSRARETAEIVAAERGLPVTVDGRLREINFGQWEGLTTPEIEEQFPEAAAQWRANDGFHRFTGGETYAQMGERVISALAEIVRAHPEETVLVVLHGGPIRGVLAHAAGISYGEQRRLRQHLANCDVVKVAVEDGIFTPID